MKCADCKWFWWTDYENKLKSGLCKRYPPFRHGDRFEQPQVAEYDRCGEFSEKETDQ